MALPGTTQIEFVEYDTWKFSEGAVLAQTLTLDLEAGNTRSRKRIETRVLLFQQNEWAGYTYVWNDEETDAQLVDSGSDEREFMIKDANAAGGKRSITWQIPSRADCLTCHSRQAGFALGLNTLQMNREHDYGGVTSNQLTSLANLGVLKTEQRDGKGRKRRDLEVGKLPRLSNPYDSVAPLTNRIRAYLYANCSHCHTEAGGGNSAMELRRSKFEEMKIINAQPQHDTFEFPDARVIAPGHPERSVMLRRLSQRGFGQMPPLSITTVDERAVRMFEEWIRSLKPD
jgi:hypothetical protein